MKMSHEYFIEFQKQMQSYNDTELISNLQQNVAEIHWYY
jgi:hypothetical protein